MAGEAAHVAHCVVYAAPVGLAGLLSLARPFWQRTLRRLAWRWAHLGRRAVQALPFYLFPAYLRPWRWASIVVMIMIVLGDGNVKYLLLSLLWVFPVSEEE